MVAGERRDGWFEGVPLLAAADRRTKRRLAGHVERLRLRDGAVIVERGRPVHWIAFALDGALASGRRSWAPGEAVLLAEALLHGVAPETVVARGDADVLLVPLPALTAAVSSDPSLGLAVARSLAGAATSSAAATPPARRRRFEHRRIGRAATVRPAA